MRSVLIFISVLLITSFGFGQSYSPKPGETVMKLDIEGRGEVAIVLHTKQAPKTTEHIIELIRQKFYDGLRFHRVDNVPRPYLVQVGDPASRGGDLLGLTGSNGSIPYEDTGFTNVAGAVGLARPIKEKDSGDSQFYILLDKSSFLDGKYTVFGMVVSGMEVLPKIQKGDRLTRVSVISNP